MKFGKYIQSQQAEWAGPQYLNYKGLKKIINSLKKSPPDQQLYGGSEVISAEEKQVRELQALKTAFFFKLERELEKINTFYLQKEADLKVRLRSLLDKRRISQSRQNRATHASLISLREGFLQFRHDLTKLQKFVEVNATGFRKILKKWDKRSKSSTKELYLSRQIEIQPCFNNDVLAELTDQGTTNLAEIEHLLSEEDPEAIAEITGTSRTLGQLLINETTLTSALKQKNAPGVTAFLSSLAKVPADGSGFEEVVEFLCKSFLRFSTDTSMECLDILLASPLVDCNYTDDINQRTCLHELAITNRTDVLVRCIQRRANVQAMDVYGRTPLHYATMHGHPATARLLLSAGATVDAIDHDGSTPLVYSITGGQTECVSILIDHGAAVESHSPTAPIPLSLACEHGNKDIAMLLLSKGAQLGANAEGVYPLHLTSREGHHEISKLLIAHGADVNSPDGFNAWAPIFYAASEGHLSCVQVLLDAGCESNPVDEFGWTPCTYALYRGHNAIAALLGVRIDPQSGESTDVINSAMGTDGIKPMAPSGLFFESTDATPSATDTMDLDELPDLSLPPPIIPFRIYGHAFLDRRFYIQISFHGNSGTAHPHQQSQTRPVTLIGSQQMSSFKMVVSSKPEVGVPYSVILPVQDDLEVYSFLVEDLSAFSLQFDVFPTFGTKPIGRGVVMPSQIAMALHKSAPSPRPIVNNGSSRSSSAGPIVEPSACSCPLFDSHLRVVGEAHFSVAIVEPFVHPSLQIGGKVETYWKSTKVVGGAKNEGVHSFVTASSLAEEYIQVVVQLTRDGVPVIYPHWHLPFHGLSVGLSTLTYAQGRAIFDQARTDMYHSPNLDSRRGSALSFMPLSPTAKQTPHLPSPFAHASQQTTSALAETVYDSFLSLQELLLTLPSSVGVSIVLKYPTQDELARYRLANLPDINVMVDSILQTVYDQAASYRSIIFMSFNPAVCTALNWKQPNYGVFFGTSCGYPTEGDAEDADFPPLADESVVRDPRSSSIKAAIRFAKSSNLLGVVCEAAPLVQAPVLIKTIKESGLLLATYGQTNNNPSNVSVQDQYGVDAVIVSGVFKYNAT